MEPQHDNASRPATDREQKTAQTLEYTLNMLKRVGAGENLALRDLPMDDRWGSFEPELNPEESKAVLDATIECISTMRSRDPVSSDGINLNDLPQTFHYCLCRYVEGSIRAAYTREDVNFEEILDTTRRWKETIAAVVEDDSRFYPQFVIAKTELLEMLVHDCMNAEGAPRNNFGKEASPSYQALIESQRAARVPTIVNVDRSELEGFQFNGVRIAPDIGSVSTSKEVEMALLQEYANELLTTMTTEHDHYLVTWGGSGATAKGLIINGKVVSGMQHGTIGAMDRETWQSDVLGHYTRLPDRTTDHGSIRAARIMVPPGTSIEVIPELAREDYFEPNWY